ncbi:MAG: MerR family transcriptional regulator [Chitinophagaceae bacterium]|nr:MerR family transcriptional regulator [Chitinophagaceae bacterium]
MNAFSIKDLENLSGIKAHTIRIWEQRYSFLKPQRSKSNIRYYGNEELKAVLNIALLNKYGFKISHIDKMTPGEVREKIISLSYAEAYQERFINELVQHMVDLDVAGFEETLNVYIRSRGIDKTISQLIFPFLEKIGILWLTNHMNVAQEHLVTNIIRQKLIVGIEGITLYTPPAKSIILFLPEGEHHELGLLYLYYLLKIREVQVLYLGANVPMKDLEFVAKLKHPHYIFTHITSIPGRFNFEKFIQQIHQRIPATQVVISGKLAQSYFKKIPPNISLKKSMEELLQQINSI